MSFMSTWTFSGGPIIDGGTSVSESEPSPSNSVNGPFNINRSVSGSDGNILWFLTLT